MPYSTNRVLRYAHALIKHTGQTFEVARIINVVCFTWSLGILSAFHIHIWLSQYQLTKWRLIQQIESRSIFAPSFMGHGFGVSSITNVVCFIWTLIGHTHFTNRVMLYIPALSKHMGHTFEISSITNAVCLIWSLDIWAAFHVHIWRSHSISEQNYALFVPSLSTWGTLLKFKSCLFYLVFGHCGGLPYSHGGSLIVFWMPVLNVWGSCCIVCLIWDLPVLPAHNVSCDKQNHSHLWRFKPSNCLNACFKSEKMMPHLTTWTSSRNIFQYGKSFGMEWVKCSKYWNMFFKFWWKFE